MPFSDPADWSDLLRQTLARYDEALLRPVTTKLVRTRNQWPTDELIERAVATVANAAVIDRRLHEVDPTARQLLALLARSHQPRWRLGHLVELVIALGRPEEPFQPIRELFEHGLLYPDPAAPGSASRLKTFEQLIGLASTGGVTVFVHPAVAARAVGLEVDLPELPPQTSSAIREADGLEWPLRLSAMWQLVAAAPLRRTQGGSFFKRDLDRLRGDAVLNSPPADSLAELPDLALLAFALAEAEGIVRDSDGELTAVPLPASWEDGLPPVLVSLCAALFRMESWDPLDGFRMAEPGAGNPYPSAYLLLLALLARQPDAVFVSCDDMETWLMEHHPYWAQEAVRPSRRRNWVAAFVLGLLYPLRLVAGRSRRSRRLGGAAVAAGPRPARTGRHAGGAAGISANTAGAAEPGNPRVSPGTGPGADREARAFRRLEGAGRGVSAATSAGDGLSRSGSRLHLRDDPANPGTARHPRRAARGDRLAAHLVQQARSHHDLPVGGAARNSAAPRN